ncbi:MAG: hypothetical protein R3B81_07235 [bacterium]
MSEKRTFAPVASAALAAFAVIAVATLGRDPGTGPPGFRLDDAWIHLVYGRGLLRNGYLAYNDGVAATGCTAPLWAAALAAVHAIAGDSIDRVVRGVWMLGGALHAATAFLAAGLAGSLLGPRARTAPSTSVAVLLAGGLVALATPLAAAAVSGMEVPLTSALLLAMTWAAWAGRPLATGLLIAAAGLTRPECAASGLVALVLLQRRTPAAAQSRTWLRAAGPPVVAALALVLWDLFASGRPLPATFYAKSAASLGALPGRIGVFLLDLLPRVPPFAGGVGALFLLGLVPGVSRPGSPARAGTWPLAIGGAFLLANLSILDPADPDAFYHQRYVWPALPALLVATGIGAAGLGERLRRAPLAPAAILALLAIIGAARVTGPESRHLHQDVRNINEVQRALGERLARASGGTWRVAASDAGAVRYFSDCETLDVIGLNTPEMRDQDERFVRAHPVDALVLLPAWFASPDAERLEVVDEATTSPYTVTSDPRMARQIVLRARPAETPIVRTRFAGFSRFVLDFRVPETAIDEGDGG